MKPKLTIILVLIAVAPLAIVGWLGARLVQDEQVVVEHGLRELMLGRLRTVDEALTRSLKDYEETVLEEMNPYTVDQDELRRRTRQSAYVEQYYVLDADGRLLFPPVGTLGSLTSAERDSLDRTREIWEKGVIADLDFAGEESATEPSSPASARMSDSEGVYDGELSANPKGWHAWYRGSGLQLMLWVRSGETTHVAEINRTRLLAELIASLPETNAVAPELTEGRIRLVDSAGRALYQWGAFQADNDSRPVTSLSLAAPLGAWGLEYHRRRGFRIGGDERLADQPGGGAGVAGRDGDRLDVLLLSRAIPRDA